MKAMGRTSAWSAVKERPDQQPCQSIKKRERRLNELKAWSPKGKTRGWMTTSYRRPSLNEELVIVEPRGSWRRRRVTPLDQLLRDRGLEPRETEVVQISQATSSRTLTQTRYERPPSRKAVAVVTEFLHTTMPVTIHPSPTSYVHEVKVVVPEYVAERWKRPKLELRKLPRARGGC